PNMLRRVFVLASVTLVTLSWPNDKFKRDSAAVIKQRYGDFKQECFPRPSGGCSCNMKDASGADSVKSFTADADCKVPIEVHTAENKKKLNEEIKQKFGAFKENCFPRPSGGCNCNEKDAHGKEVVAKYSSDAECKIPARMKRTTAQRPSQNVRDPVRERAQANYAAVVNELNEKFKGLKEGCFPRPKGCLCVIGKDKNGRDITERRMKDRDCKCQPGERGKGCPVGGA
uniref:Uncharacterized protein n=1 Tax=Parascaris univalens TaxID=6257 RepID=A0A915B6M0_PARUN